MTKLAGKVVETIKNNNLGGKDMKVELKGAFNKVEAMVNVVSDVAVEAGVVKGELVKSEAVVSTELVEAQEKAGKVLTMLQRMAEQEFNKVAVKHPEFALLDEMYVAAAKARVVENVDAIIDITSEDIIGDIAKYALVCLESAISDSVNDRIKQLTVNLTSVLKQNTSSLSQMIALENMAPELLLNIIAGAKQAENTEEMEQSMSSIAVDMEEEIVEASEEVVFELDLTETQKRNLEEQKLLLAETMAQCSFILDEDVPETDECQDKKSLSILVNLDLKDLKGMALVNKLTEVTHVVYKEYHDDRIALDLIIEQACENLSDKHSEMLNKIMNKTINKNNLIDDLEYFRLIELFGHCE